LLYIFLYIFLSLYYLIIFDFRVLIFHFVTFFCLFLFDFLSSYYSFWYLQTFLLVIVWSFLLWCPVSDYPLGIFKLYFVPFLLVIVLSVLRITTSSHPLLSSNLTLCSFLGHCILCSSLISGFWLSLWYLQIFLYVPFFFCLSVFGYWSPIISLVSSNLYVLFFFCLSVFDYSPPIISLVSSNISFCPFYFICPVISGFSLPLLVSSNFLTDISILVKTISSWIFQTIIIRHLNANSLSIGFEYNFLYLFSYMFQLNFYVWNYERKCFYQIWHHGFSNTLAKGQCLDLLLK